MNVLYISAHAMTTHNQTRLNKKTPRLRPLHSLRRAKLKGFTDGETLKRGTITASPHAGSFEVCVCVCLGRGGGGGGGSVVSGGQSNDHKWLASGMI